MRLNVDRCTRYTFTNCNYIFPISFHSYRNDNLMKTEGEKDVSPAKVSIRKTVLGIPNKCNRYYYKTYPCMCIIDHD
jgi:hypothetical protein